MPTTALVKTAQSLALARVSNQLDLTDKLLAKPEEPFLIPYRKGDKWGFCDLNKNIVIDCVYEYPKFLNEYKPANWYVHYGPDLEYINWSIDLTANESIPLQNSHPLWQKYMILRFSGRDEKALILVSTNDAIVRKGVIDGRETIIIGCRPGETTRLWWTRKPLDAVANVGDVIRTEIEADFIHEIERD